MSFWRTLVKKLGEPACWFKTTTGNLFIISLEYRVPISVVDQYLESHREFLKEGYKNKLFITSGPRVPRTGGVIIAHAESKAYLEMILQKDPFRQHGIADYQIIEFMPVMHVDDF